MSDILTKAADLLKDVVSLATNIQAELPKSRNLLASRQRERALAVCDSTILALNTFLEQLGLRELHAWYKLHQDDPKYHYDYDYPTGRDPSNATRDYEMADKMLGDFLQTMGGVRTTAMLDWLVNRLMGIQEHATG